MCVNRSTGSSISTESMQPGPRRSIRFSYSSLYGKFFHKPGRAFISSLLTRNDTIIRFTEAYLCNFYRARSLALRRDVKTIGSNYERVTAGRGFDNCDFNCERSTTGSKIGLVQEFSMLACVEYRNIVVKNSVE